MIHVFVVVENKIIKVSSLINQFVFRIVGKRLESGSRDVIGLSKFKIEIEDQPTTTTTTMQLGQTTSNSIGDKTSLSNTIISMNSDTSTSSNPSAAQNDESSSSGQTTAIIIGVCVAVVVCCTVSDDICRITTL